MWILMKAVAAVLRESVILVLVLMQPCYCFYDVIVTMTQQRIAGQVDCDVMRFHPGVDLMWERFDDIT